MSPLISASELQAALAGDEPPVVVDVRWSLAGGADHAAYAAGHLPGAVFADLGRALAGAPGEGRGRHPLPDPALLQATLRTWGVSAGTLVVAYDAAESLSAARLWWLLRWAGHDRAQVLDGGLRAWLAAGLPTSTQVPSPPPGDVTVSPRNDLVLEVDDVLGFDGALLDARAGERYRGEVEPVDPVAGHIPGALSRPTTANVDAEGRFRDDLPQRFADLAGRSVAAYCGSGVTAAHTVLALELAGISARLFPGSWSQWVSDATRPVARGAEPG